MRDDRSSNASKAAAASLTDIEGFARLLQSATSVAYSAETVEDACQWAIDHVCAFTGWPVGHVFNMDSEIGDLIPSPVWHVDDAGQFSAFVEESTTLRFKVGVGLPGRILESGEPAWIVDVRDDSNFSRSESATDCGVAAAFGFPIVSARGIEGIMEFFSVESHERDEVFLDLVANIGHIVGHLIDLIRARYALVSSEARLAEAQSNQQRILERIACGEPLETVLDDLCCTFESRYPGSRCSVLRRDPVANVLRHAAGPSLLDAYRREIDGLPVADGSGACGTAAARNQLVVVADTFTDPLTAAFVDLLRAHDLRSIWSSPFTDRAGVVTGTFAVYGSKPHRPDASELRSIEVAGSLAAIAFERQRSDAELTLAAQVDPLTGLPNRAQFLEQLAAQLEQDGSSVGVLVLDLDRFKWINDSLGHPAGDRILCDVANRVRGVVDAGDLVARFGGDEFTIMVTEATAETIEATARRVEASFIEPFILDDGEFFLSVSTGIATNDHDADAYGLVRDADSAMYSAKERGGARHAEFDERLRERAIERVTVESELRRSIERKDITLHFQPILDLRTGRWSGVEALARWQHPTRGLVSPDDFIPLAEETGLIVPLGLQILDQSAAEAALLAQLGVSVVLAANVSVVQLADPLIPEAVASVLERHGIAPEALMLEVTESALMQQFDVARRSLERITALGVRIVIDDFGTGYSSIARLGDLPVVGLKIDKSFTIRLGTVLSVERVLAAITDLAHALDLHVVAEGIERQHMLDKVTDLGCDFGQGYHLACPMPADPLHDLLLAAPSFR